LRREVLSLTWQAPHAMAVFFGGFYDERDGSWLKRATSTTTTLIYVLVAASTTWAA